MERETIIFYASWERAGRLLNDTARLQFYDAILAKAIHGDDAVITDPMANVCYTLVAPQIDANTQRYENGSKGGAPKGNQNARKQPKTTEDVQETTETTEKQPAVDFAKTTETTEKQPNKNKNKNKNKNISLFPPTPQGGDDGGFGFDFDLFSKSTRFVNENVDADDITRDRLAWYMATPQRARVWQEWLNNPNAETIFFQVLDPMANAGELTPMPRDEWRAIAKVMSLHLSPADNGKIADAAQDSNDPEIWQRLSAAVDNVNPKINNPAAFIASRLRD